MRPLIDGILPPDLGDPRVQHPAMNAGGVLVAIGSVSLSPVFL